MEFLGSWEESGLCSPKSWDCCSLLKISLCIAGRRQNVPHVAVLLLLANDPSETLRHRGALKLAAYSVSFKCRVEGSESRDWGVAGCVWCHKESHHSWLPPCFESWISNIFKSSSLVIPKLLTNQS
jgi:hypothetical protein